MNLCVVYCATGCPRMLRTRLSASILLLVGLALNLTGMATKVSPRTHRLSMSDALTMNGAAVVSLAELRSEALPKTIRDLLKRAISLDKNGRTSRAIQLLDLALEEAPDFVQAHVAEAIGHLKLHDLSQARLHVGMALELDAENIPAREVLAAIRIAEGRLDLAKVLLESILKVAPRRAMAHEYLMIVLEEQGCSELTEAHARRAEELRKHPPRPFDTFGEPYWLLDRFSVFP